MLQQVYNDLYMNYQYTPRNGDLSWGAIRRKFWSHSWDKPRSILDVGCGRGYGLATTTREFRPKIAVGIDISIQGWKLNQDIRGPSRARFVVADAAHLPFRAGIFDFVFSSDVLEHLDESSVIKALKEIKRVGKKFWYIVACTIVEQSKYAVGPLHLTVKDSDWWALKFCECGLILETMFGRGPFMVGLGKLKKGV